MEHRREISFGHVVLGARARALLHRCMETNWISAGPNVSLFEQRFRETFGYLEAVAVSSGTAAVFNALAALHDFGGSWGDEIIVPALSFVATANAVVAAGFKPVFVDVRRDTMNIDPERIEDAITPRTRGITVVHTMGKPCDMDSVLGIARGHGLRLVEDACEAHGARYKGRYVGAMGDLGAFSFYAAHIICSGEGGMITTSDPEIAGVVRSVRSHGRPDGILDFQFDRFGFNTKMNDLEAAVGIEGIENFWAIFNKRKENLNHLLEGCRDLEEYFYFTPEVDDEVVSPHAFQFTIRERIPIDFQHLHRSLEDHGIQAKSNFGSLPTQHAVFRRLGHERGDFPEAEFVGERGLHVGCHQYLSRDDLDYVIEFLHAYVRDHL